MNWTPSQNQILAFYQLFSLEWKMCFCFLTLWRSLQDSRLCSLYYVTTEDPPPLNRRTSSTPHRPRVYYLYPPSPIGISHLQLCPCLFWFWWCRDQYACVMCLSRDRYTITLLPTLHEISTTSVSFTLMASLLLAWESSGRARSCRW
jgi:hypothetical protein